MAMALLQQKCHVAPYFSYVDLRNAMVPLMVPFVSCNSNASASGVTWPRSHIGPKFDHHDLRNAMVSLVMLYVSLDADTSADGFI